MIRNALYVTVGAVMLAAILGLGYKLWRVSSARDALAREVSEATLELAETEGVMARVAEERDDLLRELADTTEAFGRVMARLERIQAQNTRLARLVASAEAEGASEGEIVVRTDTVRVCTDCLLPGDTVRGRWSQAAFESDWRFIALTRLEQRVRAEIRARMVTTELPDGRVAIFPTTDTPGATLTVEEFVWEPPPPPDPAFDFGTALFSTPVGVAVGLGTCLLLK